MKKNMPPKSLNGNISLVITENDPIAWKLSMLIEAASNKDEKIEDLARRYGYTREHFYVIKRTYEEKGSQGLMDKSRGPKTNSKRTKEMEKQIIRHRFLDPEASSQVITQRLQQAGNNISQRSVERTINEYGLQKKGYIKQLKKMRNRK
ncbi:MAG: helix-turn-helix domain containing protein [Bacteroidales bacterium]|nr:helix-turn-helix domain containing protein [Bacteroidales bacterium]